MLSRSYFIDVCAAKNGIHAIPIMLETAKQRFSSLSHEYFIQCIAAQIRQNEDPRAGLGCKRLDDYIYMWDTCVD